MRTRDRGLSGSTLKLIAIVTMLIDHIAATILMRMLMLHTTAGGEANLYEIYSLMRSVGRISFPIFCFLLVEGFIHTSNRVRYAMRLGAFALISEIPFDLAFSGQLLEFSYQNIFFTLFLGLLTMMAFNQIERQESIPVAIKTLLFVIAIFAGMGMAELLMTDYGAKGVMCIMALYLFRGNRKIQVLAGCLSFFWWELPAVIAFLPIYFYNGKRGWNLKYFFYAFYPVHLLILYGVCCALNIAGISAV